MLNIELFHACYDLVKEKGNPIGLYREYCNIRVIDRLGVGRTISLSGDHFLFNNYEDPKFNDSVVTIFIKTNYRARILTHGFNPPSINKFLITLYEFLNTKET